jgi:hypothetical protein
MKTLCGTFDSDYTAKECRNLGKNFEILASGVETGRLQLHRQALNSSHNTTNEGLTAPLQLGVCLGDVRTVLRQRRMRTSMHRTSSQ